MDGDVDEMPIRWRGHPAAYPRYARPLLLFNLAIGALLLAAVVGAAARRRPRPRSRGLQVAAWSLVLVPLPLAVILHLLLRLPLVADEALFGAGAVAFAVGAFLMLGRDEGDLDVPRGDFEPPWWPEFERSLRGYSGGPFPARDRLVKS